MRTDTVGYWKAGAMAPVLVAMIVTVLSLVQASGQINTPTGLTATPGDAAIALSWIDNSSNEQGFKIERKAGAGGTYALIATVGANVTSYSDPSSGLSLGVTYYYRMYAYNGGSASFYSAETSGYLIMNAPSSVTAANGDSAITLTWVDNSSKEAGFRIERKAGSGGTWGVIATTAANAISYSDASSGLSFGVVYYYRMYALNGSFASVYSGETSASLAINAPTSVSAANGDSAINLTWVDNSSKESGFKIERKAGAAGTWGLIATTAANATSYSDPSSGLDLGVTYYYRIYAYNGVYASVYSGETSGLLSIASPTGLAAVAGDSGIGLSWTDNSTKEAGFRIERKAGAAGTWGLIATTAANATSYSDPSTGLTPGVTYFYRLYAYNGGFASLYSAEVFATEPTAQDVTIGPLSVAVSSSARSVVDLLVVCTPAAEAEAGGKAALRNEIATAVKVANQAYVNSQVNQRLRLLGIESVNYVEATVGAGGIGTDVVRLLDKTDGFLDEVHGLRDQTGADVVALVEASGTDQGGIAKTMFTVSTSFENNALCVVRRPEMISSYALAHETAHIMGCTHDRAEAAKETPPGTGAYSYSYGYLFSSGGSAYGDIMSYPPSGATRVAYFSNPSILIGGVPIGVVEGDPASANCALTLNNTASTVAAFRNSAFAANTFTITNNTQAQITVTSITPESTASWISVLPATPFTIPSGGSQAVTVQVDFALAPGGYSNVRLLVVTNNNNAAPIPGGVAVIVDNSVPTAATPSILPNGGSFADSVPVTLSTVTDGAIVRYTTDGTDPTSSSTAYSAAFTLTSSCAVKARAFKSGYNDSAVASANFTITPTAATPAVLPNGGSFQGSVPVTLSCTTPGAEVRYTLDGSDPTAVSTLYSAPLRLTSSTVLKAKAFSGGYNDSGVASASFTVSPYPAPQLGGITFGGGGVHFSVNGTPGAICVTEMSTNMTQWFPFATNTIPGTGVLQINVFYPVYQPRGFYRAFVR